MENNLLSRSIETLADADAALQEFTSTKDHAKKRRAWQECLSLIARTYTRLEHLCKAGPAKGWFDKVKHERKNDPLLHYLHQARDANEHGLKDVVEDHVTGFNLGGNHGNAYVKHLEVINGKIIHADYGGDVQFITELRLVDVVSRSVTTKVPTVHLGNEVSDPSPEAVATLAIKYLANKLDERANIP